MKTQEKGKTCLGMTSETSLFGQVQKGCHESLNLLMARHDGLVVSAVNRQNLGDLPLNRM